MYVLVTVLQVPIIASSLRSSTIIGPLRPVTSTQAELRSAAPSGLVLLRSEDGTSLRSEFSLLMVILFKIVDNLLVFKMFYYKFTEINLKNEL